MSLIKKYAYLILCQSYFILPVFYFLPNLLLWLWFLYNFHLNGIERFISPSNTNIYPACCILNIVLCFLLPPKLYIWTFFFHCSQIWVWLCQTRVQINIPIYCPDKYFKSSVWWLRFDVIILVLVHIDDSMMKKTHRKSSYWYFPLLIRNYERVEVRGVGKQFPCTYWKITLISGWCPFE